jgi:hypothetical protein
MTMVRFRCLASLSSALTPALSPPSSLRFDAIAPKPKAKADRRGRIIRRVLSQAMCRVVVHLTANDTESTTAMRIEKLSGNVTMRSLSPGERAGVRASVNAHSIENAEARRRRKQREGESSLFRLSTSYGIAFEVLRID